MIIKNLGPIEELNLELNTQTIFLGQNNVGKTYVSYLIYGIYEKFEELQENLRSRYVSNYLANICTEESNFDVLLLNFNQLLKDFIGHVVKHLNKNINKMLPDLFNLPPEFFRDTQIVVEAGDFSYIFKRYRDFSGTYTTNDDKFVGKFSVADDNGQWKIEVLSVEVHDDDAFTQLHLDIEETNNDQDHEIMLNSYEFDAKTLRNLLKDIIEGGIYANLSVFRNLYIPAERNGINVFKNELLTKRSNHTFSLNIFKTNKLHIYPKPISDYMKYVNTIGGVLSRKHSNIIHRKPKILSKLFSETVLKGTFQYDEDEKDFYFTQVGKHDLKIPIKSSSSSTKSLFGLAYYITNLYKKGDTIFIDEPEMNLDPQNQIHFAKILFELSKSGVNLILSTHSDYLVRSITNHLLTEKIKGGESNFINTYYFSETGIEKLDDLTEIDFIDNFDNANNILEEQYVELKYKLEDR